MTADQKSEILQNIAIAMISHSNEDSGQELNAIGYEPLRDIVAGYLVEQYGKPPGEAQAIAVEILNHLRERTYILAETGDRIFGFVHRTFMEYFASRHVLAEFNRNKADYEWLKQEIFIMHWRNDSWREPLLLLVGMLAGQGSPIREIVDVLMSPQRQGRFAVPFAAYCLGEAGQVPSGDRQWASAITNKLVRSLSLMDRPGEGLDKYVEESVAAFGLLVPFVEILDDTRQLIDQFAESASTNDRIIGWRLRLILGSKAERRQLALYGLLNKDHAVRRAAVAALIREWPGDEGVFEVMEQRLIDESDDGVRETLVSALDAGWPRRAEVLKAIDLSTGRKTTPPHARWLFNHLAVVWAGNVDARQLVLHLSGRRLSYRHENQRVDVLEAAAYALVAGWGHLADIREFLSLASTRPETALIASRALAKLRPDS